MQELTRYRSEFFGRLRQILSQRSDILVVGDRFVFQAEVLFPKGQATLNPEGQAEMLKLADALKQLETRNPAGHRLGAARRWPYRHRPDPVGAVQVELGALGRARHRGRQLPHRQWRLPQHLVAAGFGEFQPIDPGSTEEAKSRNRRIELKLTER